MADSIQTIASPILVAGSGRGAAAARDGAGRWMPTLLDFLFLSLLIWMYAAGPSGWSGLLVDCDTGWHIRTGDYILQTHTVPKHDIFSFSKPGGEWFAWEWLSDILFAWLNSLAGLKAVVLLTALVVTSSAAILLR